MDRFAEDGYAFYPLRRGTFVKTFEDGDRQFFRLQLSECVFPRETVGFQERAGKVFAKEGGPRPPDAKDRENARDGYYALAAENLFENGEAYAQDEEAWSACVTRLGSLKAFRPPKSRPVFVRASLCGRSGKAGAVRPLLEKDRAYFRLKHGARYELALGYVFPTQAGDPQAQARIDVIPDDNVRLLGNTSLRIDAHANQDVIPFTFKRFAEETEGSLRFVVKEEAATTGEEKEPVVGPDRAIAFRVVERWTYWAEALGFILLFAVGALIATLETTPWSGCGEFLRGNWLKISGVFGQALAAFLLIRLVGKRVL